MTDNKVLFTKDMQKDYTILIPMMAPIHFQLLRNVLVHSRYNVELLENTGASVVEQGLKYVHNDTCYPALLVIGQMIDALKSGKYDVHKTALIITQTGGGCRAGLCPGHFIKPVRPGFPTRLQAESVDAAKNAGRLGLWRSVDGFKQPGTAV